MATNDRLARQVGNALRRIRVDRGAAQHQVADLIGIPKGQLSALERGRKAPTVAIVASVLRALDCSIEEFGRHVGPWRLPR